MQIHKKMSSPVCVDKLDYPAQIPALLPYQQHRQKLQSVVNPWSKGPKSARPSHKALQQQSNAVFWNVYVCVMLVYSHTFDHMLCVSLLLLPSLWYDPRLLNGLLKVDQYQSLGYWDIIWLFGAPKCYKGELHMKNKPSA